MADGVRVIGEKKEIKQSMSSAFYGSTKKIPTNGMEHDVLKLLVGASVK